MIERAAIVRADVFDAEELALDVTEQNLGMIDDDAARRSWRNLRLHLRLRLATLRQFYTLTPCHPEPFDSLRSLRTGSVEGRLNLTPCFPKFRVRVSSIGSQFRQEYKRVASEARRIAGSVEIAGRKNRVTSFVREFRGESSDFGLRGNRKR